MNEAKCRKGVFSNRRDWGSTVAALHDAATYPKAIEAVRAGQAWLIGRQSLLGKLSPSVDAARLIARPYCR